MLMNRYGNIQYGMILGMGGLTLAAAILLGRFGTDFAGSDLLVGILTGLSITLNLWGVQRFRAARVEAQRKPKN